MSWLALGLAAPWIAVALGAWGIRQVVSQRERIVERLDLVIEELEDFNLDEDTTPGRAIGSEAPEFALPDLDGNQVSFKQFRGRRVLVAFVGPSCKFSRELAAGLAGLPLDGREGRAELLFVSNGTVEENRELVKESGVGCTVLLQKDWEIATRYAAPGSPMGYMVDERGALASHLTMGAEELLALARGSEAESHGGPNAAAQGSTRKGGAKP